MTGKLSAEQIRKEIGHPVVDADGHFIELGPIVNDEIVSYLEQTGGPRLRDRFLSGAARMLDTTSFQVDRSAPEVRGSWQAMPSWWGNPVADAYDRATAHAPGLIYERLDEFGIDYMFAYPSFSLGFLDTRDEELRAPVLRAANSYIARLFEPYSDRLTSAALIPMSTPEEAVTELEYAVRELGFKSAIISGHAYRKLTDDPRDQAYRLDTFGVDSEADYDPFWAKCVELGVSPVSHSSVQHHKITRSSTNYVFNHIGGLASNHYELCKSLVMGGVFRRFPQLRFGFLEGGVAWAISLLADMIGHWEKRNGDQIGKLDPSILDVDSVIATLEKYGGGDVTSKLPEIRELLGRMPSRPINLDEFGPAGFDSADDIMEVFTDRMFFGCEADDPLIAWAEKTRMHGREIKMHPILGSDISHWDVPVMNEALVEAFELLDDNVIDADAFRAFTFENPVRLHKASNQLFFSGTSVESAVHNI